MKDAAPQAIHLRDYAPPDYLIPAVDLAFHLDDTQTRIVSQLQVVANHDRGQGVRPLVLDGVDVTLLELRIDGTPLEGQAYRLTEGGLVIDHPPERCTLTVETQVNPRANTALQGLYQSSGNFCTQCEAEGFRRMTYFPDRPDVMARFTTTVEADKARFPVLLANGNPVAQGVDNERHWVRWEDPFPKPSYLFALVAGDLHRAETRFTTMSGREVALHVYVEHRNADKCDHALAALKKAMKWDEEVYGREYDLDIYMIVAVDDFNMGAMENKGLNIFNSKYVLARPDTATDQDFINIEGVVAHEYFHNWSGNRVTCRDWFQLSLKEGFTVFRDQEFTADMTSRASKRINDVRTLRVHQFPEDAGPMAHPVRPESYIEINNFYTATVYEKGAEVIRMMKALLGETAFRAGTDLYFERHDGQAVTTDDFVAAMEAASGLDLSQFKRWYWQAGTPRVEVTRRFDAPAQTFELTLRQSCPPTPGQPSKEPFVIPVAVGLVGPDGSDLPLRLRDDSEAATAATTRVLRLEAPEQTFVFEGVNVEPVPSILRGFSAPVRLETDLDDRELAFLAGHDSDAFNRWEAGQQLATKALLRLISDAQAKRALTINPHLLEAVEALMARATEADPQLVAAALTMPSEQYLAELVDPIDVDAIHVAREFVIVTLARHFRERWTVIYHHFDEAGPYSTDPQSVGRRALKNMALRYLMALGDEGMVQLCLAQFHAANNMTDVMAALERLANIDHPARQRSLEAFYERWQHEPLVVDKWFGLQASSTVAGTAERVEALTRHPAFNLRNPNKVLSLIGAFSRGNPVNFHATDGGGYRFLADQVLTLDGLNPQVAARLLTALSGWRRFDEARQRLMEEELVRIKATGGLSSDVYEVVVKALADGPR